MAPRAPPAYDPIPLNKPLYKAIADTGSVSGARKLVNSFNLPIRSGRAWEVRAGQVCRIITPEGPQVGDLNIWNRHNPRERFWAARTRQLQQSHVKLFDRLWSCLPFLRPLVTVTADSLSNYGVDEAGGRVHDLLGTRCDPYVNQLISGTSFDFQCHSNLTRAVLPYGLSESDVHDVLNVFQVAGLDESGRYFMQPCPAKAGDYWEFFAETDVLCALSTCPGGDLSQWGWGEGAEGSGTDMLSCCRPLAVEVYELMNREELLKDWKEPLPAAYRGIHGLVLDPNSSRV
ncbi:meiotic chromosome segregation protein [Xylona heveae TC161]|uniref:Meiotic chromosome segregation protein n=1 Tax=Xylona heveae (strain CBS 132557 / TC161) TaxID=1328760 RepID=A0A165GJ42_XYLHT|nr:meiotic chromosome segregation protein [Xylona heveae TC161]KZF22248.1 meiotic chromosome segregation protein [Xylona heveae TC161]